MTSAPASATMPGVDHEQAAKLGALIYATAARLAPHGGDGPRLFDRAFADTLAVDLLTSGALPTAAPDRADPTAGQPAPAGPATGGTTVTLPVYVGLGHDFARMGEQTVQIGQITVDIPAVNLTGRLADQAGDTDG